jgi:hypothetical protein
MAAIKGIERLTREQQKNNVQTLVRICLERKQELLHQRKQVEDVLRVYNIVLEDLKEGRLDRIVEMQQKDPKTIELAGFRIAEGTATDVQEKGGKWYKPYFIYFSNPSPITDEYLEINCSSTKDFAIGTYLIGPEKEVIHFRK